MLPTTLLPPSPSPPQTQYEPSTQKHSLSTGASREAPVDKRAHRLNNAVQCEAKQSKAKQNTHCPQVLRAKHLWTKAPVVSKMLKQNRAKQSKAKQSKPRIVHAQSRAKQSKAKQNTHCPQDLLPNGAQPGAQGSPRKDSHTHPPTSLAPFPGALRGSLGTTRRSPVPSPFCKSRLSTLYYSPLLRLLSRICRTRRRSSKPPAQHHGRSRADKVCYRATRR